MRPITVVACITIAALAAAACNKDLARDTNTNLLVDVSITCTGDGVQFSLSPWRASLREGDEITWNLASDPAISSITINKKQSAWPFMTQPPYSGGHDKQPHAKGMKANQGGKPPFKYSVTGICTRAGGIADTVVIDPDMIIIKGGTQ
ncbi:MAG: hypothetical protein Q7S20_05070 [Gemmatimonadaceae bacterium]|nr:hypothetical protein [Gemmatimonadaceae bacterium]